MIPVLIITLLTIITLSVLNQGHDLVYDLVYASDEIKILGSSKYIDSVNYTHVVGEVQNISPSIAEHIRVSATFYDDNNTVVGTAYTFTSSDNVTSGGKAPFEILC